MLYLPVIEYDITQQKHYRNLSETLHIGNTFASKKHLKPTIINIIYLSVSIITNKYTNQMEENIAKPLKKFTINTEEETVELFKRLKEQSGISTDGQFFAALVDRYEQLQRVADRTRELEIELSSANHALLNVQQERDELHTC